MSVAEELSDDVTKGSTSILFEKLRELVDSSTGTDKLRELILQLASRGRLSEQQPADGDARTLVNEISLERERLLKIKEIRREKVLPPVDEEMQLHAIPGNWQWVRLGDVVNYNGRAKIKSCDIASDDWLLDLKDIEKNSGKLTRRITFQDNPSKSTKTSFFEGDVLYGKLRPYLNKVLVADSDGYCTTEIVPLRIYAGINPSFLALVLRRPDFVKHVNKLTYGINLPRLNTDDARATPIPLPPLAEQKRIVAKVDELMALCDQLEQQREHRVSVRETASKACLEQLTTTESKEELATAWHRLGDNFELLYDTPETVQQLRQSILELAVQGKLVPQDYLERVIQPSTEECLAHVKIEGREKPYPIPQNWCWVRLGNVAKLINGDRGKNYPNKSEYVKKGVPFINTGHIERDGSLKLNKMNYITKEKFDRLGNGKIEKRDLIYCLRGATLGKTAFVEPFTKGAIASSLMIIRLSDCVAVRFAYYFLKSPVGRILIRRFDNGSAQPNLSSKSVGQYVFPLPPLAEQKRIVAKVDELMALCDQLEQQVTHRQETTQRLLEATVAAVTTEANQATT